MGSNTYGQLGVGDSKLELKCSPVLVESLMKTKILKVSCVQFHNVALTHDGEAYAWGSNKFGQCGSDVQSSIVLHDPLKVDFEEYYKPFLRQVNAGGSHTGFIDDVGRIFTCGKNDFGQLGVNSFQCHNTPIIVQRI